MRRSPLRPSFAFLIAAATLAAAALPAGADEEFQKARAAVAGFGMYLAVTGFAFACGLPLSVVTMFLAPEVTRRAAARVGAEPVRSFFTGLAAAGVILLLAVAVKAAHPLAVVALPVVALAGVGGAAAAAEDAGRRTLLLAGREGSRLSRAAAGWALWVAAAAVPVLGWFLLGPVLLIQGVGGFVHALVTRAPEDRPAQAG